MRCRKPKFISAVCLAGCLAAFSVSTVLGADIRAFSQSPIITPYMTYISNASCDLTVSNGQATISASATGNVGVVTKSQIVIELQEKSGSSWKTVGMWSNYRESYRTSVSGSKAVTSGKTYRAKATVTVWAGTQSETRTVITGSKTA